MKKVFERWIDRYFGDEEAVVVALLLGVSILVLVNMGVILAPMIAAIIIAFLMQGMVVRLKAWRAPHLVAVSITFLVLASSIMLGLLVLLPAMWKQLANLLAEMPRMIKEWQNMAMVLPEQYPQLLTAEQVTQLSNVFGGEMGKLAQSILSFSVAQLPILIGILIYLVLVPILVFFFLKDSQSMLSWVGSVLPKERPVMKKIWKEMNEQIANYIRGKFIEIVIVGAVSIVAFRLLGLNYALLLGVAVGLSVVVPYLGAAVVTIPVALMGFFQWGWGSELLYLMIVYSIIQAVDGNVLVPLLFSEVVNLHPVVIILAVLVFGGLWGFWGVFFAIPLATLCKATINAWPTQAPNTALAS